MWNLAVGLAVTALPQGNLALAGAALGVHAVKRLRRAVVRRKERHGQAEVSRGGFGEKPVPCTLEWSHLSCSLVNPKSGEESRKLLDKLHGVAQPGRLLALMGSSGAGKTTLLNALAGQVPKSNKLKLVGRLTVNGKPLSAVATRLAYVQQEEIFYSQMTVRETLELTATLRLPKRLSAEERTAVVDSAIARLGLDKCQHTIVGDRKTRGISGGEKKRLAIACELLRSPSLIFVDEPTSGLDASQAQQVMETLKALAAEGHTVVCSLHQPRSSIFALLDDLILLSNGQPVFQGAVSDVLLHFDSQGYPCPQHYNPAEHISDLIADDFSLDASRREGSLARVAKLIHAHAAAHPSPSLAEPPATDGHPLPGALVAADRAGPWVQFRLLLKRAWRQVSRDARNLKVRLASTAQAAMVFGFIWWRLGTAQSTIQSRLGLLQVTATYIAQTSLFKTLYVFPAEKNIMARERAKDSYDVAPFFLSKLVAELPVVCGFPVLFGAVMYPMTGLQLSVGRVARALLMVTLDSVTAASLGMAVGALAPSVDAALVIGPAVMLLFLVFGGLYTTDADVPKLLRWIPKCSVINRGYEGLCVNEFKGLKFDAEGPASVATGEQVLSRIGYGQSTVASTCMSLGRILAFQYWLTFHLLKGQQPQFQPMLAPET